MIRDEVANFFSHDMCFNMRRTAKPLTNLYNRVLKERGYKFECTQYYLLIALYRVLPGKIEFSQFSRVLLTDRTTITRIIRPLVRDGFILMKKDNIDRRCHYAQLSENGKKVVEEIIPLFGEIDRFIKAQVSYMKNVSYVGFTGFVEDIEKVGDAAFKIDWMGLKKGESDEGE